MPEKRETYPVEIAGVRRQLPLFEIAPGLRIAVLNILGDTDLVEACGKALGERLAGVDYEILVTAEAKSIPLISSEMRSPSPRKPATTPPRTTKSAAASE